ncbi:MAG: HAD family hydrolase [Pyrinomonadaceae bacterium]|nr:HAD family hydrolase [Pyrinomonadaceae bacterium]
MDRDGTICEDSDYLSSAADLRVFEFSAAAIKLLRDLNFLIVIITNQSGIGRGFFDIEALDRINRRLVDEITAGGGSIDAIYFCPHTPSDNCSCRKPLPGMIEQAAGDLNIDLSSSWMIGDKSADIEAGIAAGTKTGLVLTGYGKDEQRKVEKKYDLFAENLFALARAIASLESDGE